MCSFELVAAIGLEPKDLRIKSDKQTLKTNRINDLAWQIAA
jgi:hypothetical protein